MHNSITVSMEAVADNNLASISEMNIFSVFDDWADRYLLVSKIECKQTDRETVTNTHAHSHTQRDTP